jgi:large subunit ribosomal protein L25
MLHLRDAVLVRAKPDDLPSGIELDISPLVDFEATLHASDLVMPAGVTLITDPSEALARVQQPRVEEETVVGAAEAAAAEEAAETAGAEAGAAEGADKGE